MDLLSFIPLTEQTIDLIRQRFDADANTGVDPSSEELTDTTEGGFFWDMTQAAGLELARLWDLAATEVPAVAFPLFAWGEYLDDHGETIGLDRKDQAPARGVVTFTGTDGTLVAQGTEVATTPTTGDAITFTTDMDGTISGGDVDIDVTATDPGAAGNVAVANVDALISPNPGVSAVTNQNPMSGGTDVESDEDYRERILAALSSAQGSGTIADYVRWSMAFSGVGFATVTPIWAGPGSVLVVVADDQQNPVDNTELFGLQDELDPPGLLTTLTANVTLPASTISGVTTGFPTNGTIRVHDQNVAYTGTTGTTFTGATGGTGSFVIGERISADFGKGRGLAPIGAVVTVKTVTTHTVNVAATITHLPGYSLDGTAGTIATRQSITDAIDAEVTRHGPGDDMILTHVIARALSVTGVDDVPAVTLNGSSANVAIGSTEVARLGTLVLT